MTNYVIENGVLISYRDKGESDIIVPDGVTAIGNKAFYRSGITSIVLPESCRFIGILAFLGCRRLEKVVAPAVIAIGEQFFWLYTANIIRNNIVFHSAKLLIFHLTSLI